MLKKEFYTEIKIILHCSIKPQFRIARFLCFAPRLEF
jgi:hypothetical protein